MNVSRLSTAGERSWLHFFFSRPMNRVCGHHLSWLSRRQGKRRRIFNFAKRLNQRGAAVIAFDFGGSGESEGLFFDMTLSSQADDLRAVIDYAGQRFAAPMVLLGRSFGGSTVLVEGAGDERIAGFILWSTPVFMEETFAAMLPDEYNRMKSGQVVAIRDDFGSYQLGPGLAADLARHNMNHYLQAIGKRPVLLVHAEDDELVSAETLVTCKNN